MLSQNALTLLTLLRDHVGPNRQGVGPDSRQLIALWQPNDPSDLRPALEELDGLGFVAIYGGIALAPDPEAKRYGLSNVVGIRVTEAMQLYCDSIGL